jgi:tetratricopeptide (TPR) repeat protein
MQCDDWEETYERRASQCGVRTGRSTNMDTCVGASGAHCKRQRCALPTITSTRRQGPQVLGTKNQVLLARPLQCDADLVAHVGTYVEEVTTLLHHSLLPSIRTRLSACLSQGMLLQAEYFVRSYWVNHMTDEDALRLLMDILGEQGRYQDAYECYQQTRELQEKERASIDPRTRGLAEYWRTKPMGRPPKPAPQSASVPSSQPLSLPGCENVVSFLQTFQAVLRQFQSEPSSTMTPSGIARPPSSPSAHIQVLRSSSLPGSDRRGIMEKNQESEKDFHVMSTARKNDQITRPDAIVDADLTAQLLSLASTPDSSPNEVQHSLEQKLEIFRQNSLDKDVEQVQRKTLSLVAMNPLTSHANANISRIPEVALNQYAAGITACDYLRSGSREERKLASAMITNYLPVLQTVVSEMPDYRKDAAGLLSETWEVKSKMSFHLQGVEQAIRDGEEAVKSARDSGNQTMLAMRLRRLFALYEYGIVDDTERRQQAASVVEEARSLVERKKGPAVPAFIKSWVYTGSSKYEALCRMKDEMLLSLRKAEETFAASLDDKESRIPRNISYSYSHAHLYRHKAISYAYLGEQDQAFEIFKEKLINIDDAFVSRLPMISSNRLGILSEFTFTTLYLPKALKDKELSVKLWKTHLEETKAWRSESNFKEARIAYLVMKGIWSGESDVEELGDLLVHWSEE